MDENHLIPYMKNLREELTSAGYRVSPTTFVIKGGRVRAGYRLGEILYAKSPLHKRKILVHIIGERPGNGHQTFSSYLVAPTGKEWRKGNIDHNQALLVSGIADTALAPAAAAKETLELLKTLFNPNLKNSEIKHEKLF
jgi:ethanolamine ammonia-lyase large subunit